jgi:uncharacterized membrane protein
MIIWFARDERGSVALLGGVMLALMTAISIGVIDLGSVYLDKRKAQGVLDIAAQQAAQDLPNAEVIVRDILSKNGIEAFDSLKVAIGQYDPDPALNPPDRFIPNASPANAVRVSLAKPAQLFFAKSLIPGGEIEVEVHSIGAQNRLAAFSIGSRLLHVEGGLLNALLGGLLGGSIDLSVADYKALADAQINLLDFLDALAVNVGATAGTYDQLLNTDAGIGQIAAAIDTAIGADQSSYAISAVAKLAEQTRDLGVTVPLSSLIDLGPLGDMGIGSDGAGLDVSASVMSLVSAAATASDGEHQLSLDLGATIPGLLSTTVDVDVGEPAQSSPWLSVGDEDVVVRTAQIRVGIRTSVGGSGLLSGTEVKLPVAVHVAPAEARLTDITCNAAREPTVTVSARPGVVNAWIAETDPYRLASFSDPAEVKPATLVKVLNLVTIKAQAHAEIADMQSTKLVFSSDEIRQQTVKTVKTNGITTSLVNSLVGDLELDVKLGPLTLLSVSALKSQLLSLLTPVTAVVDNLLDSTLQLLGVNIGEADVWVNGAKCGRSGLVG